MSSAFETHFDGKPTGTQPPSAASRRDADLADSWKRSQLAIGDPSNIHDVPHVPESVLDEHLLDMLGAPMTRFAEDIEGTGLALLLADARGQILQRWFEDRQAESHLDRVGTVRGAILAENVVGTNGVGTVAASGRPVQIRGDEHYADFYKDAVCTGSPVFHPITRNLLAVVTLSCDMTPRSDLLRPLVRSIATQLEQHLLSVEHPQAREMLGVFLDVSRSHDRPVVAFGPQGAMIQNPLASILTSHDMNLLRSLGEELRPSGSYVLELSTGPAELDFTAVGPTNNVVVITGEPRVRPVAVAALRRPAASRSAEWLGMLGQLEKLKAIGDPIVLVGEAGVGKLTLAQSMLDGEGTIVRDAAERHVLGTREWLTRLSSTFAEGSAVIIRGIETLDTPALDGLRALVESHIDLTVVMTLTGEAQSSAEAYELKFGARALWVPSLRARTEDLAELWRSITAAVSPTTRLELTDDTVALFRAYSWPGNVNELRRLVRQLVAAGKSGSDRAERPPREHAELEDAEHDRARRARGHPQGASRGQGESRAGCGHPRNLPSDGLPEDEGVSAERLTSRLCVRAHGRRVRLDRRWPAPRTRLSDRLTCRRSQPAARTERVLRRRAIIGTIWRARMTARSTAAWAMSWIGSGMPTERRSWPSWVRKSAAMPVEISADRPPDRAVPPSTTAATVGSR